MKKIIIVVFCLLLSNSCLASNFNEKLHRLETEWEQVHYNFPKEKRSEAFQILLGQVTALSRDFPAHAEPVVLQALVILTKAATENPFVALSSVNKAKALLLKAIEINPRTNQGSAYVTLGTLYHKVPGWPISFGDDEEAEKLLLTALKINPNGVDCNYFYADFLLTQGDFAKASEYFKRTINAPAFQNKTLGSRKLQTKARLALKKLIRVSSNHWSGSKTAARVKESH